MQKSTHLNLHDILTESADQSLGSLEVIFNLVSNK